MAALAVLALGMYISFTRQELAVYSLVALLLGFTLTQIGMYMGNKFGRSPRPDEKTGRRAQGPAERVCDIPLHHPGFSPVCRPAGVWAIKPYHQQGKGYLPKKSLAESVAAASCNPICASLSGKFGTPGSRDRE